MSAALKPRVLIADDQQDVLEAVRLLLKGEQYEVETAKSPAGILAALEARDFDAVLMDLNYARDTTSGQEGLDLLHKIQALDWTLPTVVMTAWASTASAVEAMRRGAYDYVEKPWDNSRLLAILRNAIDMGRALRKSQRLESENQTLRRNGMPQLIADSAKMRPVLQLMERIGPSDANVLITGEHGTGKELVAHWLHAASSRAPKSFVAVNMGGLSEGVFESELFGHVKGSFTDAKADRIGRFELADQGTLFLDEIANITVSQQSKLLRVLQTGDVERVGSSKARHVDVRVLSATNADLHTEVAAGRFREDLLFRLNTIEIHLPPLRERREDIPLLVAHFITQLTGPGGLAPRAMSEDAVTRLGQLDWPGNVRELRNTIERLLILANGPRITADDVDQLVGRRADAGEGGLGSLLDVPTFEDFKHAAERAYLIAKLRAFDWNVSETARALDMPRSNLYKKIERYALSREGGAGVPVQLPDGHDEDDE